MQRPRRTSEFQDDPTFMRRNSRNNLATSPSVGSGMVAACAGGTAKKYSTRQSRIAVPSRPSSSDRSCNNNPYLSVPTTTQRGVTPQKTPLPKTSANRVLFTAEKQRPTTASNSYAVPLHNDKKWVHDATQRITEHLLNQGTLNGGINTDFLVRGLRQMSIKQFIAIINYFLGNVWGNRFTVGSNYVDDIISILQKLKYPYPLNKSWLKTPNTQHSFGNVVVLLDFLMDFVPENKELSSPEEMYFNFEEPKDFITSKLNDEHFQIPDLEFQQQLLSNSKKGFLLWDKQKIDEFNELKQKTCNILLQKMCNVANLEEMEFEIQKTKEILKCLENERPPEDKEKQKLKNQLSLDLKNLNHDIKALQAKCETNKRNIKELSICKREIEEEVDALGKEVYTLQENLNKQPCTIEQRDEMIENVMQHRQMLAITERTIQDLQNRYHNEQILKSKAIKQLNDQIEKYNTHMREIKFSDILKFDNTSLNDENLELSLRPHITDVEKLKTQLERINQIAVQSINETKKKTFQLQEHCKHLKIKLDAKLFPKLNDLKTSNTTLAVDIQKLEHFIKKDENELLETIKKLNEDLITAENTVKDLQDHINNKKFLVEELIQTNEQTMKHAEEKHKQQLEQRKAFLKTYDEVLEAMIRSDELQQLTKQVELQEKLLEELKKEF